MHVSYILDDTIGDLSIPAIATSGSAGFDLQANIPINETVTVLPFGGIALIKTGLRLEMPRSLEAQIRPRSGLALKHAITVLNSPGTIDSDYRGEVGVILINHGDEAFIVRRGMRIAQMVFSLVPDIQMTKATYLNDTARGSGGFGSTGVGLVSSKA